MLEAAELGIRNRGRALERKVLQAASMGYTKGVAAGKASAAKGASAAEREADGVFVANSRTFEASAGGVPPPGTTTPCPPSQTSPLHAVRTSASGFEDTSRGTAREWESSADAPSTPDPSVAGARGRSTRADAKEKFDARGRGRCPR